MTTLIKNISSLVTMDAQGKLAKVADDMQNIGEIKNGAILFGDNILWTGSTEEANRKLEDKSIKPDTIIDAHGKTILPGFADSHTHIVFGGNRSGEFARRLRGVSYVQIAEEGGGILTTVKGTRESSIDELADKGRNLALSMMKHGTTSAEIKSGYGLTFEAEMNQLKAIQKLKSELPMNIKTTFLGAHDFPPEFRDNKDKYIDLIVNEMIPYVAEHNLADYCDAFVDKGYYTITQGERVLQAALDNGLKLKLHADELADVSAAQLAAKMGAVSADHLLFVSDESIKALKKAGTVATLLPGTAYFIRMPYAPARKLIEAGATVALSTDCNPGSCFTENMQMILSLSVINMAMTAEEALAGATINGAKAMEISDKTGSLEVGKQADFIVADIDSYTDLFYHFGINHVSETWIKGKKIAL